MIFDGTTSRALIAEMADQARIDAWNRYAGIPHADTKVGRAEYKQELAVITAWEARNAPR